MGIQSSVNQMLGTTAVAAGAIDKKLEDAENASIVSQRQKKALTKESADITSKRAKTESELADLGKRSKELYGKIREAGKRANAFDELKNQNGKYLKDMLNSVSKEAKELFYNNVNGVKVKSQEEWMADRKKASIARKAVTEKILANREVLEGLDKQAEQVALMMKAEKPTKKGLMARIQELKMKGEI